MCDIANSPMISMGDCGHYIRSTLFKGADHGRRRRRSAGAAILFKGADHGRRRPSSAPIGRIENRDVAISKKGRRPRRAHGAGRSAPADRRRAHGADHAKCPKMAHFRPILSLCKSQ